MKLRIRIPIVLAICFAVQLTARAVDNPRDRLDHLRAELDSLTAVLDQHRASERDLGDRLNVLDQQIAARRRLIRELETQRRTEQKAVRRYDSRIDAGRGRLGVVRTHLARTRGEVSSLEELIAKRAVFLYMRGGNESLRYLLSAKDPGELFRRRLYVQRIYDRDQRNLEALRSARTRQANDERELEATLADLRTAREKKASAVKRIGTLVGETKSERASLEKDHTSLNHMLANVRRDKKLIQSRIADREAAAKQVEEWIAALERRRTSGTVQEIKVGPRAGEVVIHSVHQYSTFRKARGHLPWPVKGRIISRFGLEKNTDTGTLTENPGIDIQAHEGDQVIAVQGGDCTRITYLRGFGTTVLIEHGDGYYTVYAHLGDVWVSEGEHVEAGRVLGTVGTSGAASSPRLHFQVWHKRQKENPLNWLSS